MQYEEHFRAFIDPKSPDVFRSVLSTADVWRPDPLDVPSVHAEARARFEELVTKVSARIHIGEAERMWLVQGSPGCGKTHLMGAFRTWLHENRKGFMAYLQMQTGIEDYAKYILYNVIDSLSKPMSARTNQDSALEYLSRAIYQDADSTASDEDGFDAHELAEKLVRENRYAADATCLAALLSIQLHDSLVTQRVIKYFRGEALSARERESLGGVDRLENAIGTIKTLADIAQQAFDVPLVICLDQLDDFYGSDTPAMGERFGRAIKTVRALADHENILIIISILDEQYEALRPYLLAAELNRLESGTIMLRSQATAEEIADIVEARLAYLYDARSLVSITERPLYPFEPSFPSAMAGARYRGALRALRDAQLRSMASGQLPFIDPTDVTVEIPQTELAFSSRWNDFRLEYAGDPDIEERYRLLSEAVANIASTLAQAKGARLDVERESAILFRRRDSEEIRELVVIADKPMVFGHLKRQIEDIAKRALNRETAAVAVRSSDFPSNPKSATAAAVGEFIRAGNRRVAMSADEWRTLSAFDTFRRENAGEPGFEAWIRAELPLASLPGVQTLLELDVPTTLEVSQARPESAPIVATNGLPPLAQTASSKTVDEPGNDDADAGVATTAAPPISSAAASKPSVAGNDLIIGSTEIGEPVTVDVQSLTRHVAILGSSGSGKTTLAFCILEALLARGVPAILLDRKGDLATYASDAAWSISTSDAAQRTKLRESLDVQLFTPGITAGRNLRIAALPERLGDVANDERAEAARAAALGLSAMMEWGKTRNDRRAALTQAIETYTEIVTGVPTLAGLIEFIADADPRLLNALGQLKPKLLDGIVNDLSSLSINAKQLLPSDAEPLDMEMLFGLGDYARPGKTRLSIIYVGGLGEGTDMLFWVSRFLSELLRFGRRKPKGELQGVAFFDEADRYLPATSKPITKEPMESGLRRLRAAGIGLALATQSPGDLDYKPKENISTWLAGKVSQPQALEKLRPVFASDSLVERLPAFGVGQFVLKNDIGAKRFRSALPIVMPRQLEESEIVALAAEQRRSGTAV